MFLRRVPISGGEILAHHIRVWVKIYPPDNRRFQSLVPFIRATHFEYAFFDPQPYGCGSKIRTQNGTFNFDPQPHPSKPLPWKSSPPNAKPPLRGSPATAAAAPGAGHGLPAPVGAASCTSAKAKRRKLDVEFCCLPFLFFSGDLECDGFLRKPLFGWV